MRRLLVVGDDARRLRRGGGRHGRRPARAAAAAESYRVDAVFDRTAALIPGQKVKIAGAPVGLVTDIKLTEDRRARVQMEVEEGFAPFRADARCIIRAEALIGEKFVQCDPGSARAKELEGEDGEAPTVPLERNTVPVEIDTLLATFRRPYRERFRILINEFGIGLAGRSDDLDATIRRANPALREANELLRVLASERETLKQLIEGSDAAFAELADAPRPGAELHRARAGGDRGHRQPARRAERVGAPGARRCWPRPSPPPEQLSSFAREATPIARQLRAAAPAVNDVLEDVAPLSEVAVPTLVRLSRTAKIGRRTVRAAMPVAVQPQADGPRAARQRAPDDRAGGVAARHAAASSTSCPSSTTPPPPRPGSTRSRTCCRRSGWSTTAWCTPTVDTADCEDGLGPPGSGLAVRRHARKKRARRAPRARRGLEPRTPAPAAQAPRSEAPAQAAARRPAAAAAACRLPLQPERAGDQVQDLLDWLLGP